MKTLMMAALVALLLPACTGTGQAARHKALCGGATLQLYWNLQKAFHKSHAKYAGFIEQLNMDPPQECRNDWFYDLKTAADGQSYLLSVEQRPDGGTYTIDQIGFLRDPAENAALAKGKK
ncbi:MAG: hypothetical protein EOP11_16305 [Proteobacteria bacterium]|nr:MAG: hypothetical protein EOP11_16305 [Pseudomonadota bacterium]